MPIYEYQCTRCSERFAVLQSIGEDGSKLHCPKCNTQNPKRVLSSFFTQGSSVPMPTELNLAERTKFMRQGSRISEPSETSPPTRTHPTWYPPHERIREFKNKMK